jgi:hypothetical protein
VADGIVFAKRFKVCPVQTGVLLDGVGAEGGFTIVTLTVPAGPVQPFTVAVTEYVPAAASVTLGMLGFCSEDVNPLGPFQL